jgi:hypothetical protein
MFASPSWEEEEWDQSIVVVTSSTKKKNRWRCTKRHQSMNKTNMMSISKHRNRINNTNKITAGVVTQVTTTTRYGCSYDTTSANHRKNNELATSLEQKKDITKNDTFKILSLWYYGNGDFDGISDISNSSQLQEEENSDFSDLPSSSSPAVDVSILGMEFVITRNK